METLRRLFRACPGLPRCRASLGPKYSLPFNHGNQLVTTPGCRLAPGPQPPVWGTVPRGHFPPRLGGSERADLDSQGWPESRALEPFLDTSFPQLLVQGLKCQLPPPAAGGQCQIAGAAGKGAGSQPRAAAHLDGIFLVGDEVDAGLHAGVGALPEHVLLQLVDIWGPGARGASERRPGPAPSPFAPARSPHSPSNRPEKLSVARHRFFFLPLFLASGMSMGRLAGISALGDPEVRPGLLSRGPLRLAGAPGPPAPPPSSPALTRAGRTLQAEVGLPEVGLV